MKCIFIAEVAVDFGLYDGGQMSRWCCFLWRWRWCLLLLFMTVAFFMAVAVLFMAVVVFMTVAVMFVFESGGGSV